jgi:outer membrane protein OmpA-like peptidoglycan-associated protein
MIEARSHIRSGLLATAAVAVLLGFGTGPVRAQYSDSVTVDLSVIGGGYDAGPMSSPGVATYAPPAYGSGNLRMPGTAAPPSRFYPPSGLAMPAAPSGDSVAVPSYSPPKAAARKAPKAAPPPAGETAAAPPPPRKEPSAPPARLAKQQPAEPPAAPALPAAAPEPPPPPKMAAVQPKAEPASKAASAPPPAPALKKVEQPPAVETAKADPAAKAPAPSGDGSGMATVKVVFTGDSTAVPSASRDTLKALAGKTGGDDGQRLQLVAYASGPGISPSSARRLSLSRALAVRNVLIEAGVASSRIDVRALGDKPAGEPANRVDVNLVDR